MSVLRWTEERLAAHQAKPSVTPTTKQSLQALGRLPVGMMNKTEARYAAYLDAQMGVSVLWWRFEGIKLRLADSTFLTPDFAVMNADRVIELHEVKGFMLDDANVKLKVAASQYPFTFFVVRARSKTDGGGWKIEAV